MATPPKPPRRNNADPESTRREILQAALEVLAKDGPESLSVAEVARRAGVNRGTAYQHFPTREDLAHATAEWVSERIYDEFYGDLETLSQRQRGLSG
jgi:AcrR family transcriptional regulator